MDTASASELSPVIAATGTRAAQSGRQREHGPLIEVPDRFSARIGHIPEARQAVGCSGGRSSHQRWAQFRVDSSRGQVFGRLTNVPALPARSRTLESLRNSLRQSVQSLASGAKPRLLLRAHGRRRHLGASRN